MGSVIQLGVYRRLDNRLLGQDDNSAFAVELHERRKHALHEILDNNPDYMVVDWGNTNTPESHELVALSVWVAATVAPVVLPALKFVGELLVKTAVETATSEGVKGLIPEIHKKQEAKQIADVTITLEDGHTIRMDPPEQGNKLTITVVKKNTVSISYDATAEELVPGAL
jgi:hypothetical protein